MQSQQKSDGELLQVLSKMIAIILMFIVLGVLGFRYFGSVDKISAQGLRIDHTRLLHVLSMVRAQWLAQGQPAYFHLVWDSYGVEANTDSRHTQGLNRLKMTVKGWPLPERLDTAGCEKLWQQLLGKQAMNPDIVSEISAERDVCSYIATDYGRISYRWNSGQVVFLIKESN